MKEIIHHQIVKNRKLQYHNIIYVHYPCVDSNKIYDYCNLDIQDRKCMCNKKDPIGTQLMLNVFVKDILIKRKSKNLPM